MDAMQPPLPGNWVAEDIERSGPWTIGRIWTDLEDCRYCLQVAPGHCNAVGAMHGGAMATLLDAQVVAAASGSLRDVHTPTISLSIDYLAPALAGDWVVVSVELVRTTRSMIVTQALARAGDRVIARSNAIYSNTRERDQS